MLRLRLKRIFMMLCRFWNMRLIFFIFFRGRCCLLWLILVWGFFGWFVRFKGWFYKFGLRVWVRNIGWWFFWSWFLLLSVVLIWIWLILIMILSNWFWSVWLSGCIWICWCMIRLRSWLVFLRFWWVVVFFCRVGKMKMVRRLILVGWIWGLWWLICCGLFWKFGVIGSCFGRFLMKRCVWLSLFLIIELSGLSKLSWKMCCYCICMGFLVSVWSGLIWLMRFLRIFGWLFCWVILDYMRLGWFFLVWSGKIV